MAIGRYRRAYVEGIEDIIELFEGIETAGKEILVDATKKGAEFTKQKAKELCPVKTGKLRDSIDIKINKTRKNTKAYWSVYVKSKRQGGVNYAFAVEGGTRFKAARPFLRPALDNNTGYIKNIIASEIANAIDRLR